MLTSQWLMKSAYDFLTDILKHTVLNIGLRLLPTYGQMPAEFDPSLAPAVCELNIPDTFCPAPPVKLH